MAWAFRVPPSDRPQTIGDFRSMLFASHAGALGLEEALRRGDDDVGKRPPRGFGARMLRVWRSAARPGSWPLAVKMAIAMVATAVLPMSITAWYNLEGTSQYVPSAARRHLE